MASLLKTISHEKPAKGHSHPVGTESLSEALQGIEQFDSVRVKYLHTEGDVLGEKLSGPKGEKLHGAGAKALDGYREIIQCSWTEEEEWTLTIYAVPSSRKASVKTQCNQFALPELRRWLEASRAESWFIGHHALQIGMSEFTDEIAWREAHNDHIVEQKEFLR